jgi:Histidine kinase-like ATPase domain
MQPQPQNCNYREEYAWLFYYERRLLRQTRDWLEPHRHELIGAKGLFSEALSNAYAHGNQRDPTREIIVELIGGHNEHEVRITHSGNGFDVNNVLERFRNRSHYYNIGGNGLRKFDESATYRVFFDDSGRTIYLWYTSDAPAV